MDCGLGIADWGYLKYYGLSITENSFVLNISPLQGLLLMDSF